MPGYTHDHAHLRSRNPKVTAHFRNRMFDVAILESVQSDGGKRIDLNINCLTVFIARVSPDEVMPAIQGASRKVIGGQSLIGIITSEERAFSFRGM